ncbi:hypothetical protein N8619_02830, partial [Akkermansiaceae bacterium]|nr:hypothetical protein [Akkermansiaceae bacterium]
KVTGVSEPVLIPGQNFSRPIRNFRRFGKINAFRIVRIVQERLSQFFVDDAHSMTLPTSAADEQGERGNG